MPHGAEGHGGDRRAASVCSGRKKSQLVPNWGWFLAKPLAAVLRIVLLLLHLLLLDVVTIAIEPAASQAVAR